jgi:DNA mismatch repair ATPase MutS
LAAERWRAAHGERVRGWLEAIADLEALMSIAAYSYEHPDDVYPELVDGPASLIGAGLGHPLIPQGRCVRNDVSLTHSCRALLVSGSNMSGKSTLLRTIGVNAVLAMAGAPVRAARLRLTPMALGASIRVTDSLQEGRSRFYAQIERLRVLADLSRGPLPLLFLLDELLHGTNSHDRLVGSQAVLRSLQRNGAIGLITTHDLALADIAGSMQPPGENVHFEDQFEAGAMKFDYKLRPGVVRKSNALELMRSVGLEV